MDVICEVHVNSLLLTPFSVTHFVNASKQEGHLQQYSMMKNAHTKTAALFREGISGSLKVLICCLNIANYHPAFRMLLIL